MTHDPVTEMSPARRVAVAAAADGFGVDLYRRLGADQQNLVFSPASIAAALQMALVGARGRTAAQLAAVGEENRRPKSPRTTMRSRTGHAGGDDPISDEIEPADRPAQDGPRSP